MPSDPIPLATQSILKFINALVSSGTMTDEEAMIALGNALLLFRSSRGLADVGLYLRGEAPDSLRDLLSFGTNDLKPN